MVKSRRKTKSVRTMTMKRIQPTGNVRELTKRPPRDMAGLAMKMKVKMKLQGENEEGQSTVM